MAYNENTWNDGDVITASGMNNMEGGIKANDTAIGDLANLTTTAKSNLVAAINEAVQSGGGGSAEREWTYLPHRTYTAVDAHNSWSMKNTTTLGTESTLRHNLMLENGNPTTGYFVATWTESTGDKDYADSTGQTSVYAEVWRDVWNARNTSTTTTVSTSVAVDVFPHNETVYDGEGTAICTIVAASDSTIKYTGSGYIIIGTIYGSDNKYHIVYRTASTTSTPSVTLGQDINVLLINGEEWDMTTLREDYTQKTSQLNTKIVYRSSYYYMAVVQNGVGVAIMKSSDCIDWSLQAHIPDADAHLEACMCAVGSSSTMPTVFVAVRHQYGDGYITLHSFRNLTFETETKKIYIPASSSRPMACSDSNANQAFICFSVNGRRNAVVIRIASNNDGTSAYEFLTTPLNVMSNYPVIAWNNKLMLFGGTNGLGSGKNGVSVCPIWSEELTGYNTMSKNLLDVVEHGAYTPAFTSADEGKFLTIDGNGDIVATALSAWTGGSY